MSREVFYHAEGEGNEKKPVFITRDPKMERLYKQIERIATTEASVLITGDSGTGKEVVFRLIHAKSHRRQRPFVALNCAAIPKEMVESELFGHERGAFTGAVKRKKGCFELADKGTLFLDEIAEMELGIQVKLLRAVEYKAFRRLGGSEEVETDVRIVAATNKDMTEALENEEFRKDLFYRLSVVELHIPPLRERKVDIPLLARYFMQVFSTKYHTPVKQFSDDCISCFLEYEWPGNVRELRNTIERCVIMCPNDTITTAHITPHIAKSGGKCQDDIYDTDTYKSTNGGIDRINIPVGTTIREAERKLIDKTLSSVNYNKSEAARILGFSRATLHNKLDKYGS